MPGPTLLWPLVRTGRSTTFAKGKSPEGAGHRDRDCHAGGQLLWLWPAVLVAVFTVVMVVTLLPWTRPYPGAKLAWPPVGGEIFLKTAGGVGCAACHGAEARGLVGPDIRGKTACQIVRAVESVDAMKFIKLSSGEVEAVSRYLADLAH